MLKKHLEKLFYFSWFTVDLISPAIIQSRLCRLHNLGKSSSYRVGKFPSVENRAFQPYYVHRWNSRGCGDLIIWFGGRLCKSFQGPHSFAVPSLCPTIRLPLVARVSHFILSSVWAPSKCCSVKCRHPLSLVNISFIIPRMKAWCSHG